MDDDQPDDRSGSRRAHRRGRRARGGGPPRDRARIKTAREWGDLKENSEYHDAKNDQAHLETKIAVLRERLARAEVVEVSTVPVGVVSFGSGVHVRDEDGREQHFEIVSSQHRRARAGQDLRRVPGRPRAARHAGRRRGDRHAPSREPPLHGRPARLTGPPSRRTPGDRALRTVAAEPRCRPTRRPRAAARAAGTGAARQVHRGASEHQAPDRPVAARADDEEIHASAEEGELLAGDDRMRPLPRRRRGPRGPASPPRGPPRRPGCE